MLAGESMVGRERFAVEVLGLGYRTGPLLKRLGQAHAGQFDARAPAE